MCDKELRTGSLLSARSATDTRGREIFATEMVALWQIDLRPKVSDHIVGQCQRQELGRKAHWRYSVGRYCRERR